MAGTLEIPRYQPKIEISPKAGMSQERHGERMRIPEKPRYSMLSLWVNRFDDLWDMEGLTQDWYNLKGVGFSMEGQMDLLEDASDGRDVAKWTQKTKQDLLGFKLEYLSDHLIYPCRYEWNSDGTRLENKAYGNKDIDETVSAKERKGSVKKGLQEMKEFFRTAPDGAIAVMPSPQGDSGLKTDAGESIYYPDSYFFIMQKKGDEVINFTLKTDFSVPESRKAIYRLTGKNISPTAPLEEYVDAIAKIKPREVQGVAGVVDILKGVRDEQNNPFAWDQTSWNEVYQDIQDGEKLYNFNEKTQQAIADFEEYAGQGGHTKFELKKAVAATILRMSKLFFVEENPTQKIDLKQGVWQKPKKDDFSSFGAVLVALAARPGCAGGGRSVGVESVGLLLGMVGGRAKDWFTCPESTCKYKATGPIGDTCPGCGLTKDAYAAESGISCD